MSSFERLSPGLETERSERLKMEREYFKNQFETFGYPEHRVSAFRGPKDNIAMIVGIPHINNDPFGWPIPLMADAIDQFRVFHEDVSEAPAENIVFIREGRHNPAILSQTTSLKEAVLYFGHPGFTHYVGEKIFGARVLSGEPDCYEQELVQKEGFSPELVAFYCCLRNVPQTFRRLLDDDATEAYLRSCFEREGRHLTGVADTEFGMELFELEHIAQMYESFYGHSLLPLSDQADFKFELAMSETVGPMFDDLPPMTSPDMQVPRQSNSDESVIREICSAGNLLRDRNYFQVVVRELEAGNDVVLIAGTPHGIAVENMFRLSKIGEPLPLEDDIYAFQYEKSRHAIPTSQLKLLFVLYYGKNWEEKIRENSQVPWFSQLPQYPHTPPLHRGSSGFEHTEETWWGKIG